MKVVTGVLLVLAVLAAQPTAAAETALHVGDGTVVARGITPGAEAAMIGIARTHAGYHTHVLFAQARLVDDDRDGVVRFAPPWATLDQSIWIAADLASGAVAIAGPTGDLAPFDPTAHGFDLADAMRPGVRGMEQLSFAGRRFHALVVRPGVGAWNGAIADGAITDADGFGDGVLSLALGALRELEGGAVAPLAFEPDDVLILLDPDGLRASAARVGTLLNAIADEEVDDAR